MTWTREKPNKPGRWLAAEMDDTSTWELFEVVERKRGLYASYITGPLKVGGKTFNGLIGPWFFGPLPPVKEE